MGASLRDRATRPTNQAPAGLGDTASVPSASALKILKGLEQAHNHALMMDAARVFLGKFLAKQGLAGQLLNRQAAKVYDAAVLALVDDTFPAEALEQSEKGEA